MSHFADQKPLHKRYTLQLIEIGRDIMQSHASLVDYEIEDSEEFTVCGDIHGQYYDLMNIFKINGNPALGNKYLFNGDFVDRGSFSVECILTLIAWKCANR
jgi:serine/threonine-protein phosphatase 5